MQYKVITSKENALVKQIIKLANNKNYRNETGLAVVYGQHLVEEAYKHNLLESIVVLDSMVKHGAQLFIELDAQVDRYVVSSQIMQKINILDSISDIVGIIRLANASSAEAGLSEFFKHDCVVLDNIQDPGNLGTIFRSAAATGVKYVVISANSVDPYNPKVLRASQGMQFGLLILYNVDVVDFISQYQGAVLLTAPHANQLIYDINLRQRVALVFGNEGSGISQQILALNNCTLVKIPMNPLAESLNVAMAATVCLFEVLRQRV